MTRKRLLKELDADELVEWQAWMTIQREREQTATKQASDPEPAEDQLRKLFGKRE